MDFVVNGSAKGQAYDRLALFTDTFGNRLTGSKNLEDSIGKQSISSKTACQKLAKGGCTK